MGKKFITWTPGVNVTKLFSEFTNVTNKSVCPGKPFQPSLIFAGKAGAYKNEVSFKCFTIGQASGLTHKHQTRLVILDKHSCLLLKFYNIGPNVNIIKLFYIFTNVTNKVELLVPGKPFQHSLIFAGKAEAYSMKYLPNASLRVGPWPCLQILDNPYQKIRIRESVNYGKKVGPSAQCYKTFFCP